MDNKEIEKLLKPAVISDQLFMEREPLYLIINVFRDRYQLELIEIQKEVFNQRELLKHQNAKPIEFLNLRDRYKEASKELSTFFMNKEYDALKENGINDIDEMMGIFKAVRQLRDEGRLKVNSPPDLYLPEKDLFITRKLFEVAGLPPDVVDQYTKEYELIDKTMKHYKEVIT